jgi:hypothetical protein
VTERRPVDDTGEGRDAFRAAARTASEDPDGWPRARIAERTFTASGPADAQTVVTTPALSRLADGPFAHPPRAPESESPWVVPPASPPSWIEGDEVRLEREPAADVDPDQWAVIVALARPLLFEDLAGRLGWSRDRLRGVLDGMVDEGLLLPSTFEDSPE